MKHRWLIIAALFAMLALLYVRDRQSDQPALPLAGVVRSKQESPMQHEGFIGEEIAGQMAHVSSVTALTGGRMVAVWYAGSREGASDVAIFISEFNGTNWGRSRVLLDRASCQRETGRWVKKLGNPMIFRDQNGRLWLFFASVAAGGWSTCSLNYKVSSDGGQSWTPSRKLVLSPFFNLTHNVKNKPLLLDDGSWLLPVYHELIEKQSAVLRVWPKGSDLDYQVRRMTRSHRAIQPALLAMGGPRVLALFRNMEGGPVLSSASGDMGQSWSEIKELAAQNPDAGMDAIRLNSGALLAAMNGGTNRAMLILALSEDGGITWRKARTLENQPGREYSYPSLAVDDFGDIHLSYTFERRRIKHRFFNEAWVREELQ